MRKLKRKLSAAWSNKWRQAKYLKGSKINYSKGEKIGYNHAYNKKADIRFKGSVVKRKWKNPKAGLRRKRYYTNR